MKTRSKRKQLEAIQHGPISWDRLAAMFDYPVPPRTVTERQFDYMDDDLRRLAATPYDQIDFSDLWYYFYDMAYVELQLELFAYLFPVCLMDWHLSLERNESCAHGLGAEFHNSIRQGHVLRKMLTADKRQLVYDFFRDSFLQRLAAEQTLLPRRPTVEARPGPELFRVQAWICRFNSLGLILDSIADVWNAWWSLNHRGCAIAVIEYCSCLVYPRVSAAPFPELPRKVIPAVPCEWVNDSLIYSEGWLESNVQFIEKSLTLEFVHDRIAAAAELLSGSPEFDQAVALQNELARDSDLCRIRIEQLPALLADPSNTELSTMSLL